ncbi:MAG: hypothetical protein IH591_12850, partial [Bacteroidales bacterium]|nr:hypothetical protein [Bacteroidales bacterium]
MNRFYKIFHPEVFQGSLKRKNYFEGWYFKNVSASLGSAVAIIPGISLSDDRHSFVQFIDGINRKTAYFRYPVDEFAFSKKKLEIRVGNSSFSDNSVTLDLANSNMRIEGMLSYDGQIRLPKSLLTPGIMGWYSYIPTMECNHGVVSVNHNITGSLSINGTATDFSGGTGYIEKDWGISFPESWVWLQCNNFSTPATSLMISIAKIPWKGHFFIGLISFLHYQGRVELFATYNGSKVISLKQINRNLTEIVISRGRKILTVRITKSGSG